MLGIFARAYADGGDALLYRRAARCRSRTGLVVVVDDVDVHALAAVASLAGPVVDYVVAHVHALVHLRSGARAEARRARRMVDHEVVVV